MIGNDILSKSFWVSTEYMRYSRNIRRLKVFILDQVGKITFQAHSFKMYVRASCILYSQSRPLSATHRAGCKGIYKGTYIISLSCIASLCIHYVCYILAPHSSNHCLTSLSWPNQLSKAPPQRPDLKTPCCMQFPIKTPCADPILCCWTTHLPTLIVRKQDIPQPQHHTSPALSSVSYHFNRAYALV